MKHNEDTLLDIENRLQANGIWCTKSIHDKYAHKMVAKHPKATIAISHCGMLILPFRDLRENNHVQHCLVCELFSEAREEANRRHEATLLEIATKYEQALEQIETNQTK